MTEPGDRSAPVPSAVLRAVWLMISCLGLFPSCQPASIIPITPIDTVEQLWGGIRVSVLEGVVELDLVIEDFDGSLRGSFTMGGNRSGTLTGRLEGGFVDLILRQTSPCSAEIDVSAELFNEGTELAGLWSSVECDGRLVEGALTLLRDGETAAPRAFVDALWDVSFSYGSSREDGQLDVFQTGAVLDGQFVDDAGIVSGALSGVVTGDVVHMVVERSLPCSVPRSVAATVGATEQSIDGSWFGPLCSGTQISSGRFAASN